MNALLTKESQELYGLFPPRDAKDSHYLMLMLEITRVHQRQQDYRNAYVTIHKLVKVRAMSSCFSVTQQIPLYSLGWAVSV